MDNAIDNIRDIKKFCNDADAWYLISMPADTTDAAFKSVKRAFEDLNIPGKFVIVSEDVTFADVTDQVKTLLQDGETLEKVERAE
jgi:hypothetical protein